MARFQKITPFLWFESDAENAVNHYVAAFPDARITALERYPENPRFKAGEVMTVAFELAGQSFTALNGGARFIPNESFSLAVACEDQREIDFLWDHLSQGGTTSMCGWLKDRWGFSWQIVPRLFIDIMTTADAATKARTFEVMMEMTKFDVAAIERAIEG